MAGEQEMQRHLATSHSSVSLTIAIPAVGTHNMTDADVDKQLVADIRAGKRTALAALYDKYIKRMFAVAYRILQNRGDAEDLMHDVFVEAWQNLGSYNPTRSSVYSWLIMRVRSRAIDRLRVLKVAQKHAMLQKPLDVIGQGSRDAHALLSDSARAQKALKCLSDCQRQVIELGYHKGLNCREISTLCDIPLGTVKSRLASAVSKLRAQLKTEPETF